jgi:hypothetical protein
MLKKKPMQKETNSGFEICIAISETIRWKGTKKSARQRIYRAVVAGTIEAKERARLHGIDGS